MNLKQAIETLEQYNTWRRGADTEMPNTATIGTAIDVAVKELKKRTQTDCADRGNCDKCKNDFCSFWNLNN